MLRDPTSSSVFLQPGSACDINMWRQNTQPLFIKIINFKKHLFGGNGKCISEENYLKLLPKIGSDEQTYEISFLIE